MTSKELLQKINKELSKSLYMELINVEKIALSNDSYSFYNIYYDIYNNVFHTFSIGPEGEKISSDRLMHLITIDRRDLIFKDTKRNLLINNLPSLVREDMEIIKRKLEINSYFERRN